MKSKKEKPKEVYVCNPDYVKKCEFRLEDGRCTFEGPCDQKILKTN